jgi:hypothetical protein
MAIRHLLLAALVSSAFSAHATPGASIYASTGSGTVLLATSATGQVQTYMPRAVEGFFRYTAPTDPFTAPVILADSGQSTVPPASAELINPAPADVNLADLVTVGATTDIADIVADLPPAEASVGARVDARVDAAAPTVLLPLAVDANALPEPGSSGLVLAGLAGVGLMARRRRSR